MMKLIVKDGNTRWNEIGPLKEYILFANQIHMHSAVLINAE